MILTVIAALVAIAGVVCSVLIVAEQYRESGPIQVVLGVVSCGMWPLVWAWMNAAKPRVRTLAVALTALIVLFILVNALTILVAPAGP